MRKSGLRNGQSPNLKVDFVSRRLINNIYFMIHWLKLIMYMDIYNSRCRCTECRRKIYNCTFSSGSEGTLYFASSISTQHNLKIVSSHGKLVLGLHSVWHTAICSSVTLHAWLCAPYVHQSWSSRWDYSIPVWTYTMGIPHVYYFIYFVLNTKICMK